MIDDVVLGHLWWSW